VAGWAVVGIALVRASEVDPVATALLCEILKGGSAARTAAFNPRKTETHPKRAIARAGLDEN